MKSVKTSAAALTAALAAVLIFSAGTAAYAGEVSFGAKAAAGSGLGTVRMDSLAASYGADDSTLNPLGGFTLDAHVSFGSGATRFMIQSEAGMLFNNGTGNGFSLTYTNYTLGAAGRSEGSVSVSTVEIPLLLGADFVKDTWTFTAFAGPYISIPLTGSVLTSSGTTDYSCAGAAFGVTAGVDAALKAGTGAVVMGARYLFDLSPVQMKNNTTGQVENLIARRAVTMDIGYRISL